jgi:hypothetical protein
MTFALGMERIQGWKNLFPLCFSLSCPGLHPHHRGGLANESEETSAPASSQEEVGNPGNVSRMASGGTSSGQYKKETHANVWSSSGSVGTSNSWAANVPLHIAFAYFDLISFSLWLLS